MTTQLDPQMLAARLAAQDQLIGQLMAIVVSAGLIPRDDLARIIAVGAKQAKKAGDPHLSMILTLRAASVAGMAAP